MNTIDLIGQRFGRLVVTGSYHKRNPSGTDYIYWVCRCDCGGAKDVRGAGLRDGVTKSCGCLRLETVRLPRKHKNVIGKTFSRLTVLERVRRQCGTRTTIAYRCVCSCDNKTITTVDGSKLVSYRVRSCGCLRREMTHLPRDIAASRHAIYVYKRGAKARCLDWDLTDETAIELMSKACYYCGIMPTLKMNLRGIKAKTPHALHGIDRLDSSKGYTLLNSVSCCGQCNYAKRSYSHDSFISMCCRVANIHGKYISAKFNSATGI